LVIFKFAVTQVSTFAINVVHLILGFCSPYLKKVLETLS